jgi:hypothetical protein
VAKLISTGDHALLGIVASLSLYDPRSLSSFTLSLAAHLLLLVQQ